MPIFQRKTLRRSLGLDHIRDLTIGTTGVAVAANASLYVVDSRLANTAFSGEQLFGRAWLRVGSGNLDFRVASFNAASGAYVTGQINLGNAVASYADFEIHETISPSEKDRALDDVVKRIRLRQEVGILTVDGALAYTIAGAASPNTIADPLRDVLDCYYFANPTGSLDRRPGRFDYWGIVTTATGPELRVSPALQSSQQIVLDAVLVPTLGAADEATVSVPDERWLLAGAAMKCFDLLIARSPGQEVAQYKERRKEKAIEFTRLSADVQPQISRKTELDEPFGW